MMTTTHIDQNASPFTLLEQVQATLEQSDVQKGMDDLFRALQETRDCMESEEWISFARLLRLEHPLRHTIHQDPMTQRAFQKPRGYAGDAVMMDLLYGIHGSHRAEEQTTTIGRQLYQYIQNRPAGKGVCFRREHIAALIDEIAATKDSASVLAIASGHLREAELSSSLRKGQLSKFVALDADLESLDEVDRCYSCLGVKTMHASVRHLLARKVKLDQFDFVYAAGLYDYLNDAVGEALTARMFALTKPGGQMLIPNFATDLADRAYMETYMDWNLIYRDEYDMVRLLNRIAPNEITSYDVYRDPVKSIVFLRVWKA